MKTLVYVSNADSGSISVLALDERSGALATLQTLDLGGMLMPMALLRAQQRLVVVRRSEPFAALSLAIAPEDGRLALLGEGPLPASMAYVWADHSERFLFSASYHSHLIAVSPIGSDGIAAAPQQVLPTGPNAHAIRTGAGNRFVFSTSLGGGAIHQWRFDAVAGTLTPNDPPLLALRPGAGPRHLELHPNGRFAYLLNELDASVDVLALDPVRGTLALLQTAQTLPPDFAGGAPWAADLHLTPDAQHLFTSERRSSTLAALRVEADGARLVPLGHTATQAQPRSFAITPSGRWLVVAGQLSHQLGVHALDAPGGALPCAAVHDVGRNPSWVEILALP